MKLSDGIILGTTLGPQIFGKYFDDDHRGGCALGSALIAAGATPAAFPLEWEWARNRRECEATPPCGCVTPDIGGYSADIIIVHLNDKHKWSREKIAEWVRSIEPEYSSCPEVDKSACASLV